MTGPVERRYYGNFERRGDLDTVPIWATSAADAEAQGRAQCVGRHGLEFIGLEGDWDAERVDGVTTLRKAEPA